jgi:hypothetical protein
MRIAREHQPVLLALIMSGSMMACGGAKPLDGVDSTEQRIAASPAPASWDRSPRSP